VRLTHGRLNGEGTDVLPALLEEGNQKVDGQNNVRAELLLVHADVTDGNTEAENLLKLELNGGLELNDLGLEILLITDGGGEHTHLVKLGTKETRDLTDEGLRRQETIVLVGYNIGIENNILNQYMIWWRELGRAAERGGKVRTTKEAVEKMSR
jgi:hypothetical protein